MEDNDLMSWLGASEIAPEENVTIIISEVNDIDTSKRSTYFPAKKTP